MTGGMGTRRAARLRLAAATLAAMLALALPACDEGGHQAKPDPDAWTTITTSEDGGTSLLVLGETGIEYLMIQRHPVHPDFGADGMCERWDSDGTLRHDGAATMGGAFGLEVMEVTEDGSGQTVVLRDRQTGIAYRYYSPGGDKAGGGLFPCYDGEGRLQRYDDDKLMPVTGGGSTGDGPIDGAADEPADMPADAPGDASAGAAGTQPGD